MSTGNLVRKGVAMGVLLGLVPGFAAAESEVTRIHLDQHNGYFAAEETLGGMKAGEYEFVVRNKAGKAAGFQLQNHKTHETLEMFPLEPGEARTARVTVTGDGVRYRCPINPTPWYELDNIEPR